MSMDWMDYFIAGHSSSCCGATVYIDCRCKECGEHCEAVPDDPEEREEWLNESKKD